MEKHSFTCPHCEKAYTISTYHIDFSDVNELRCCSCASTLSLNIYSPKHLKLYEKYGAYNENFVIELESMLKPCKCGGTFRFEAPYRCKFGKEELGLTEIKRQINLVGSEDGRPGLIITGKMPVKNIWK